MVTKKKSKPKAKPVAKKAVKRAPKAAPKLKLYKVVSATGESIHGGSMKWSLPVGKKAGAWHEVTGALTKCSNGLHLTTEPARWWKKGARCFEVEAEGVIDEPDGDCKVVARRVRMVREIVLGGLVALNIFTSGVHHVAAGVAIASGSASVKAYGSASVEAYGSASVEASNHVTTITHWGSPKVALTDCAVCVDHRNRGAAPTVKFAEAAKADS
jgi:hypothetical protein